MFSYLNADEDENRCPFPSNYDPLFTLENSFSQEPEQEQEQEKIDEKSTQAKTPEIKEELEKKFPCSKNIFLDQNPLYQDGFNLQQEEISNDFISDAPSIQEVINQLSPNEENQITENKNQNTKSIKFNTKTKDNVIRIDYLIKKLKVKSSQYMVHFINSLIQKYFPKKNLKISKPNSKYYTSVTKAQKNLEFMKMKLKEILVFGKEKETGTLQNNNFDVIKKIEAEQELKDVLEDSLENFYQVKFFDSDFFDEFCSDPVNIRIDDEFRKERGYSLRSKSGFFKYLSEFK